MEWEIALVLLLLLLFLLLLGACGLRLVSWLCYYLMGMAGLGVVWCFACLFIFVCGMYLFVWWGKWGE